MPKTKPKVDPWIIIYECATPAGKTAHGDYYGLAPDPWAKGQVIRQFYYHVNHN